MKESYNFVRQSEFSQTHKSLFMDNLLEDNKSLVKKLFGEKGIKEFEKMLEKL